MARTILEIATEAAERRNTAPPPSTLFGDTNNRIARILRTAAKDTIRDYLRIDGWQGLSEFHGTWSFNTRPGVFAYQLPPDFLRPIPGTENRANWPLGLVGPSSPQTWAAWLSGISAIATPMGWMIRNNTLRLEPPPASAEVVSIDYVSRFPVVSDLQLSDLDLTSNPISVNSPMVPRDGYLSVNDPSLLIASGTSDFEFDSDPGFDLGKWVESIWESLRRTNPLSAVSPLPQVRRAEFTADTDKPTFDDDYLLSLGMTFRLRRALGLDYAEEGAEYEKEMDIKGNSDAAAGGRTFCIGGDGLSDDVIPLGNGQWMVR